MTGYMIINLCEDGYNYWIKAIGFIKQGRCYDIIFESAKDVLYSKTFQEEGKPIEVNVDKQGHLMLRIDYRELNSVQAFDDTKWNLIKSEWDKKEETD